jgi:hypothetical protein
LLEEHLLKDKTFRKYAAVVDKALALFETALEEWADYISFLNRLLKVCYRERHTIYEGKMNLFADCSPCS